jgi:hypothetical protein
MQVLFEKNKRKNDLIKIFNIQVEKNFFLTFFYTIFALTISK